MVLAYLGRSEKEVQFKWDSKNELNLTKWGMLARRNSICKSPEARNNVPSIETGAYGAGRVREKWLEKHAGATEILSVSENSAAVWYTW